MAAAGASRFDAMLRVERQAGELRANLLRLLAVAGFYGNHLIDVARQGIADPQQRLQFSATAVVVVMWGFLIGHVIVSLRLGRARPELMYLTTGVDLVLTTVLLMFLQGATSWLVLLYLLVIASTPLRLSVSLVRVATCGAWSGYLVLVVRHWYFSQDGQMILLEPLDSARVVIVLLAIGVSGLFAGQAVRQTLRIGMRGIGHSLVGGQRERESDGTGERS